MKILFKLNFFLEKILSKNKIFSNKFCSIENYINFSPNKSILIIYHHRDNRKNQSINVGKIIKIAAINQLFIITCEM